MKQKVRHIIGILLLVLLGAHSLYAQNVRYVQQFSVHALTVPENPEFRFEWTINYNGNNYINVSSNSNITHNISWNELTTYHVSVRPLLDSVGCYGEYIYMDVVVVQYLSLHTFDDIYFTDINVPVSGDVSSNDFDEKGSTIYYNPTPVSGPSNGTLVLNVDGTFTYTPANGFVGIDRFVYEAHSTEMYQNALVTIVVNDARYDADLHIEKTGPAKALYGQEIVYNINVRNDGPVMATNVIMRDTLAFGLFDAKYAIGNGSKKPWNGFVSLGDMNPGDITNIYIFTRISEYSPQFIFNQAITYSDTFDSEHEDNESIWMTEISSIYVDLPGIYHASSCDTLSLVGFSSDGMNKIASYTWFPTTGLSNPNIANPIFTPDENTIGKSNLYILTIVDILGNVAVDSTYIIVDEIPYAVIEADTLYKDKGVNLLISGSESSGDGLNFWWSTDDGNIVSLRTNDTIEVNSIGKYTLQVTDNLGCDAYDSVVVLLQSYPPIAINDTLVIEAGTDSTINVLLNDYDINGFDLTMNGIVTPPNHSTIIYSDTTGLFTIKPNSSYWKLDSIEYRVCNNGYPIQCSTAWIIIDSRRPPLNADVFIMKSGDNIAFWGDTIHYHLTVSSNGPDSATVTTIYDQLNKGFYDPEFSLDAGLTWNEWKNGRYVFADSLRPGVDAVNIDIRAKIRMSADSTIYNKAYIETNIIENKLSNDTAIWETKIKELVYANAGRDTTIGDCVPNIELGGYESTGRALSYSWRPTTYLSNPNSVNPTFNNPGYGVYSYTLTVTDDDGISDTDVITITVLPPPLADAGEPRYMLHGGRTLLLGEGSKGTDLTYTWETIHGHIIDGQENSKNPVVDTIGVYYLTIEDNGGCIDHDSVEVFWFYFDPFVIPDYYSVLPGGTIQGNVLANDYEPNALFEMFVTPGTFKTKKGSTVTLKADGSMTFIAGPGLINEIDHFTYEVCNNNPEYLMCKTGYAQVTISLNNKNADLNIKKIAVDNTTLAGRELTYVLKIHNYGPDQAESVLITDSLSKYLKDAQYNTGSGWSNWDGDALIGNIAANADKEVRIKATVVPDAPSTIFNAAMAASKTFDPLYDWFNPAPPTTDPDHRNVDTVSVAVSSDLLAVAELIEQYPADVNKYDNIIGACDKLSILSGAKSASDLPIERYEWAPRQYLTNPDGVITAFKHPGKDTTITFTLTVVAGNRIEFAYVTVHFSEPLVANAGPDRKMNEGEVLIIDGTGSKGIEAKYEWFKGSTKIVDFESGNQLLPKVYETGVYNLYATDKHGCTDDDDVIVRENQLFVVSDILNVVINTSVTGNVLTNDYDPDPMDTISFSGVIFDGPSHGTITGGKALADGTYTYTPDNDFTGSDKFSYILCDSNNPQLCDTGTVYIRVIDVVEPNSAPVANHDFLFVNKNETLIDANIFENDYDQDGGTISFSQFYKLPAKGTVSINDSTGMLEYIPFAEKTGYDYFTYQICDNGSPVKCDVATVNVYIHKLEGENHRPVAVDDAFFAVKKAITGNVLNNDYDTEGDDLLLTTQLVSSTGIGDFEFVNQDGDFIYTPAPDFEGTEVIVYEVCERNTNESYCSYATIYITVLDESRYSTDVIITKNGPAEALSSTIINYELVVLAAGPTLANSIIVSDTLFSELTNVQYSLDEMVWKDWNYNLEIEQLMLYHDTVVYIRAKIPDIYSGELVNGAWADMNSAMTELDNSNNYSEIVTEVYQNVIANAGSDTIVGACKDVKLNGSGSLGVNMKYSWTPSEFLDDPTLQNPTYTPQANETTTFMLVVTSTINDITDNDTSYVVVEVVKDIIARAGDDWDMQTLDPVLLDGGESSGTGILRYEWYIYDADGNMEIISNYDTLTVNRSGSYYLSVYDEYDCSEIDRVNVTYPIDYFIAVDDTITTYQETPVDIYILRNDIIDEEDSYNLDLLFVNEPPKNGEVIERPYDSIFTYVPNPYFHDLDSFVYFVSTKYFSGWATVYIRVLQKKAIVPEAFSPNGDNVNDNLLIENIELYESNTFVVFNRWGSLVYEKTKYDNSEPWDGIANRGIRIGNGVLPTGVYYYILDLGDDRIEDAERVKKGFIYIASDNRR